MQRILKLPEVKKASGKGKTGIYEGVNDGTFPAPVPLGSRAVGWLEDDILKWQADRVAERDRRQADRVAGAASAITCPSRGRRRRPHSQ